MSRQSERIDEFRRSVLREWRGCDRPAGSAENVRHAGDFLAAALDSTGTAEEIDGQRLREAWAALAGELVAAQCEPVGVRDGQVRLRVLQPAMRFHLEQIKPLLLARLRAELGEERVSSLRFELG